MGDLLDSKTNKQILIGVALSLMLVMVGIAVEVFTGRSVFEYIALGVGKIFGDMSLATYRNVKTDAPIREVQARLEVAKVAKEADIDVSNVLQTWRPEEGEKK